MAATIFNAAAQGNLATLRALLDSESPVDINAKDESGSSALVLAVQGGHVDVIQELVARGAERSEAQALQKAQSDTTIGSLLSNEAVQQYSPSQYPVAPVMYSTGEMDVHGGQRLPDGTVSYMYGGAAFVQPEYPVMGQYNLAPNFPSEVGQAVGDDETNSHERKESAAGQLPPPEVARTIPCRFFPNCRYADKCVFYHPDRQTIPGSAPTNGSFVTSPVSPNGMPVNGALTSPGPSHVGPNSSPMFYQAPPPGYGYAPPYGPPQHFYMNPPLMGGPLHYSYGPGPVPLHFTVPGGPDGEVFSPGSGPLPQQFPGSPAPFGYGYPQGEVDQNGYPVEAQYLPTNDAAQQSPEAADSNGEEGASTDSKHAGPDAESSTPEATQTAKEQDEAASGLQAAERNARPSPHRRQSFNSFLHHHAIPFQPTQLSHGLANLPTQSLLDGSGMSLQYPSLGKARRAGFGGTRFSKYPSNGSRPRARNPCTFFAIGNCRYGDSCNFPHVLPGGTELPTQRPYDASLATGSLPPSEGQAPGRVAGARKPKAAGAPNGSSAPSSQSGSLPAPQGANLPVAPHTKKSASSPSASSPAAADHVTEVSASGMPKDPASNTQSVAIPSDADFNEGADADHKKDDMGASSAASPSTKKEQVDATIKGGTQQSETKAKINGSHKADQQESGSGSMKAGKASQGANGSQSRQGSNNKPRGAGASQGHLSQNGPRRSGNGQQQQSQRMAPVQQRVPTFNDFPALGGAQSGHGATSSSSSPPAPSAAPKANFSAILSAPAPKKEKIAGDSATDGDKKGEQDSATVKKEKKAAKNNTNDSQVNSSSAPLSKRQAPQVDADGFSIVPAKMAAKATPVAAPAAPPAAAESVSAQVASPTLAPAVTA